MQAERTLLNQPRCCSTRGWRRPWAYLRTHTPAARRFSDCAAAVPTGAAPRSLRHFRLLGLRLRLRLLDAHAARGPAAEVALQNTEVMSFCTRQGRRRREYAGQRTNETAPEPCARTSNSSVRSTAAGAGGHRSPSNTQSPAPQSRQDAAHRTGLGAVWMDAQASRKASSVASESRRPSNSVASTCTNRSQLRWK